MGEIISARVFLGTAGMLTDRQELCLQRWLGWLADENLDVVRLRRDAYSRDPWQALTRLMPETDGAVLLGFRQLDVRDATWRPETDEEEHFTGWQTTSWLQAEAGMAISLGLPVLVAPDAGVREGVFRPSTWGGRVHGAMLNKPESAGPEWLDLVRRHRMSRDV